MSKSKIFFDKISHTYRDNIGDVPSVTQIINDLLPLPFHASMFHLNKGSKVHRYAAKIGRGEKLNCDPKLLGHIKALRKFYN